MTDALEPKTSGEAHTVATGRLPKHICNSDNPIVNRIGGGYTIMIDGKVGSEESQAKLFNVLANPYRHAAMAVLKDADGVMTLEDLADEIVSQVDDCPKTAEELHLLLRHIHAPKLAEAGLIDFDPRQEMARFQGDSEQIDRLLT